MALVPCSECGNQVSTLASSCPKCGAPRNAVVPTLAPAPEPAPKGSAARGWAIVVVGALLVTYFVAHKGGSSSNNGSPESATPAVPVKPYVPTGPSTIARTGYTVKVSSHSFPSGEVDITLNLIYRKKPSLDTAFSALASEVAEYVRGVGGVPHVEVMGYAHVGDPEKEQSWKQMNEHGYYARVWFDGKTNSILKGNVKSPEPLLANVLSGSVAETVTAAAKADAQVREQEHEKNKVVSATMGAKLLLGRLRSPESLKLESAMVTKDGLVCYQYRAQNGFGGVSRERAVWIGLGLVMQSDDDFAEAWNHWCAGQTGTEEVLTVSRAIEQGIIK
jgi:hypothetical protein